ncbi:MAG TPA: hypothetical protein VJB35_05755 [Candidatus Nanoarchaeia archaeon]|nr:hypothetical protein [Candidatus Nanoarchaeia archaeon]
MNKGTKEGTIEEVNFVKKLNKDKKNLFWNKLINKKDLSEIFAVRVNTKKFGKINGEKVLPKSDVFLIETKDISLEELQKKDFLLEENDLEKIKFKIIPESGISIKRIDSIKYQILKMSPNTFKKVFGNYELGAGASIYCNEKELEKNKSVLRGWKTNEQEILSFFKEENLNLDSCKRIKTKSNQNIFEMINTIKKISDFVFKGTGNFEEPFLANWFYERGNLSKSEKIPFIITTGSGRSKGVFTLVVKPK